MDTAAAWQVTINGFTEPCQCEINKGSYFVIYWKCNINPYLLVSSKKNCLPIPKNHGHKAEIDTDQLNWTLSGGKKHSMPQRWRVMERNQQRDWWRRGVNVWAQLIPLRWEVREECFQRLQPCPTCALLRMHCDRRKQEAGRATVQAHQSTLTSRPYHTVGVFPLDRSLNHL